ncbi:MAG TPA: hypothetical protein VJ020_14335, partial [Anaerolineales bacterium]|nr:hypothetical protein [Anaerolineales bacterium]
APSATDKQASAPAPHSGSSLLPITSGDFAALDCGTGPFITLQLPNGNRAVFSCTSGDAASLTDETEAQLPDDLPASVTFISAVTATVLKNDQAVIELPAGATLTTSFIVPLPAAQNKLAVFYWDTTLNDGLGGWAEAPDFTLADGRIQMTTEFTGTFVLVTR